MQESVTYQAILEESRSGRSSRQTVHQDERRSIALDLLTEGLSIELIAEVSRLSIAEVTQLQQENGW
jgi:predicted transposase YdaD